jgi:hypothetical protein
MKKILLRIHKQVKNNNEIKEWQLMLQNRLINTNVSNNTKIQRRNQGTFSQNKLI